MARTRSAPEVETVCLHYELFDLPTAQHKAGLAGLVLQIRSMQARGRPPETIPVLEELRPSCATIQFTKLSVQGVLDDLYAARPAEVSVRTKWSKATPKRVDEVTE